MKNKLLFLSISLLCFFSSASLKAQTATVFSDDFTASAGTAYTTAAGAIGTSSKWNLTRSGTDFGAKIDSGIMTLSNDASASYNNYGWVMASTSTTAFSTPYSSTLSSNPGMVTWSFNMRQITSNPSGFFAGYYGAAFILAGTSGTTNSAGTGYAVILGNSGKTDPLKLVRYNAGLQSTTQILASNTSGLTDFANTYLSVKVTYTPSTNTWQLYVRNDGIAFLDPSSGSLTSQGTAVNTTYTGSSLPIMGGLWNTYIKANQTAFYDNVKVTVGIPTTTSLTPPSKVAGAGAFTLTVNGTGFVSGTSVVRWNGSNRTTTFVSATQVTAAILATDITSSGSAAVTVANGAAVSNAQTFTIDAAGIPNISLSTSNLTAMTTVTGTASAAQTYTISGSNLTTDVTVTAPTNFEVSSNGTTYSGSLTLTRTGSTLVGQPVTVYARVKTTAPAGLYTATINHTTTGGAAKTIAVTATVLASKPTTQATTLSFTGVTSTTFTANWTNGNGANHLVLIKNGSAVNAGPVDGLTYTAVNAFGSGSEIGTGNYVVYKGNSNTVNITGLDPGTTYYLAVYDYNGSGGTESYLTTSPPTGNRTTLNAPVGWQIYTANTTNVITFDTTVDGVNEGIYQAAGMSPTLTEEELNSNAWAITGFSDGAIAFGGSNTDDQDYDRGTATNPVSVGGVYAFETSNDNFALGIKPATGDFAPGFVTLRFQNQTGAAITSLSIGYKVYVYNDEAASSSFNFSHSADNASYTSITGLNVVSPAAADAAPGWKSYYRVVTLTGLNITNNNYYYFRWSGATVSGSTDFDAFGLDDIVMVANPSTNYASFSGNADNFVVLGNTILSGATTVANDLTLNGGKVTLNGNTLTLNGTVTNTTSGGLKGSASSNLIIGGAVSPSLSFDQTTLGTTNLLNNLSINTTASNTVTVLNPVVVNGTLTTALGQTLNMGTNALTGTLTGIANNGIISTQNTTSLPLPSGKTWSGTGIINYNAASAAQTIVVGTYQNITSSSTGGAAAAGNLVVNGILNLPTANPSATVGSLSMGSFTLTMGGNATNAGIGDAIGIVTRNSILPSVIYTFGNTHTSIFFSNTGTLPTSLSLKIAIGVAPSWRPGAINRTYDFIQTGSSGTKAVIKAHYLDSELNGNSENKLVDWAYIVPSSTTLEQGRSNYSTTDNWVELTNVNVGLYFTGTFGQVLLTLDDSAAGSLTWNGSVSDSWTTAVNWTPNATPSDVTVVYIPDAATTPNDPTLNPAVLLGSLNIEPGGILNAPANSQFTVNNGGGAWINNGTFNPGTGTSAVIFTNADATMAGSTNFNNITVNTGATLRPLTNNVMQIAGTFTVNGAFTSGAIEGTVIYSGTNQTIVNPNGNLQSYHNLIINGTGAIFPSSLNISGDLTLNQSVDFTGKTLAMIGTEPQLISGTAAFNNLTINNTAGDVSLGTNVSVNGTLALTSGILDIGNYNLLLGAAAVSGTPSSTNMVIASGSGELRRIYTGTGSYTFPIGDNTSTAEYSPITVSMTAGSFSGAYVGVSVVDAIHPNNSSTANNLTRYWKVNQSGITGAVVTITANYTASDLFGTEGNISGAQLNGTFNQATNPWIRYTALASNAFTATGAVLTAGQTSTFTGIKGGTYSATISGYGSFCLNDAVTLTATPTGGDAPYTYSWSNGLGTQDTATPPTITSGTVNYTVTIKDSNGITATDNANVVVAPYTVGGAVSSSQTICSGTAPANITLSGHTGNVTHWESSLDAAFTTPMIIASTSATLTSVVIGNLTATTYFRAVVQSGICSIAYSNYVTISVNNIPNASAGGSQTICATSSATVNGASSSNGTILWTHNGHGSLTNGTTLTPTYTPTIADAGTTVLLTMTVSNSPCTAATATYTVVVNGSSVGGSVTGGTAICSGTTSGLLTLSGYTGTILRWEYSVSPFTTWTTIANTSNTYTSGALTQTTQFRAVVQNGVCAEAVSTAASVSLRTTNWIGEVWDNGAPDATTAAVISDYFISLGTGITACSLTIANNTTVVISSGDTVTLSGALKVNTGSTLTFESNANLIQTGSVNNNTGSVNIKRDSSPLRRLDYTAWSSPVTGSQTLLNFSPKTSHDAPNNNVRFYTYNSNTNFYDVATPAATTFAAAKGYLIRMPNNHPTTATIWTGKFAGVPNNGNYNFTMTDGGAGQRFNLVGNPYPSPIAIDDFVSANDSNITGTLYFWRKTNNAASPTYCTWTTLGFVSNNEDEVADPNGILQTGQGFFVEASGNGTTLSYTNAMRVDNHDNQFFKTTAAVSQATEKSSVWLNVAGTAGSFSQMMVGYAANATQGVDAAIDGKYINDGAIALTSLIDTTPYTIQGRALPFEANDVVPLHFKAATAGNYTIAIDHADGLFSEGQEVYLRDNLTGTVHDLHIGGYVFSSTAGTFASRFELLYQLPLGNTDPEFNTKQVIIYKNASNEFVINTGNIMMASVKIFDIRGRFLTERKNINTNQITMNIGAANELLLAEITSEDGITVTKKVIR